MASTRSEIPASEIWNVTRRTADRICQHLAHNSEMRGVGVLNENENEWNTPETC